MSELLQQRQEEIAEEFEFFEDWMERYEHIIELGKELDPIAEADKLDEHLIRGCQSRVWLLAAKDGDGNVQFRADSDAIITKGLAALMVRALSGLPPAVIVQGDLWFIEKIGLDAHLSPTRANGLRSMVQQMKHYGIAFQAQG
jgi:cysteine desulfuration protein SufE|tara:strand:+ start:627 stop:1055 length:429 start_codon:yes stop_codon:yes gene_type:complete